MVFAKVYRLQDSIGLGKFSDNQFRLLPSFAVAKKVLKTVLLKKNWKLKIKKNTGAFLIVGREC